MEKKNLPKVLVVSTNAWKENTGINTLIELFKCWDSNKIAQIYTKSTLPKTQICNIFFSISENAVMKSILRRNIITGKIVRNEIIHTKTPNFEELQEQKLYSLRSGKVRSLMAVCREVVWKFGRWKTQELNKFIDDFNADVLFIPIYPTIYMGRIQKYIISRTKKPVVSYLADDNYTYKSINKNIVSLIHRFFLRKYVKYIIYHSSRVLVIAPKQKEECDRIFGIDSVLITKGIDFEPFADYELNKPIKLVYTGKLIIGRWKSLSAIADALGEINKNNTKAVLDIYTTDTLTNKQNHLLNRNGCSVKGSLSLEEVKQVQKKADILVFVESLENKYKKKARLSFSTKITDYLKSGKCIFAIGDKEIAPIDYFNKYDSAVTASSYKQVREKLVKLIENPEYIKKYARKGYNCGIENHDRVKMDELLISTIKRAKSGDSNEK